MDLREHDLRFPESWIPATPAGLQRAQTAVGNWRESVVDFSFDLNTCDEAAAAATATPACFSFPGSPFQDWHQIPYANFPAPEINAGPHLLPQNLSSTMPMFFTGESPVLGVDQLGTQLLLNRKAVLNSDLFLRGAVYPSLGAFGPFSPTPAPVTPEKTKFMQGERGAAAQRGLLIPNGKGPITLCFDGGASAPSPPPQEIKTTETGTNEGVDFDKTPPRKPRRKKHRPKVIREGKPARTPKQSTPKQSTPKPATPQQSTPKLPAKPSPESAVNASGKRSYTRRNSEVNPSSERSQASERREPLPTKRRLEFPPEGDSQPVESKSTPNPLTDGALAACLNSPDIPSLQLQPSRRELIRWNLKKLARMRDGAFFHVDSSLTFEAPHPSNIDQSASNLKEVPKKKRTERTRNGKTHLEFEEVKQVAQSMEKSQQNSQEKFANGHDMDLIIRRMESLDINGQQSSLTNKETALVPYGSTGAIVSYEGQFHQLKKVRPKVVLDEETHRMWNLLMGKEVNGADVAGKNKEKWWEEERRVFRGRIDSFIAKMHLVQGDRRFSPWKGSVLDSVIGVFLTQNVSDHLSSSAFMAMSARFPPVSVKESPADKSSVLHDLVNTRQDPIILKEQEAKSVGDIDPLESQHSEPAVISPEEADFLFMNNNPCDLESKISFTELLEMATSRNLRDLYIYGNERPADTERFPAVLPEESSMGSGPCLSGLTAVEAVKLNPESGGHNQVLEDSGQKKKKGRLEEKEKLTDWDELRREACRTGGRGGSSRKERSSETMDSLDWEAVKRADVDEISSTIRERGMNNMLAERIKGFLKRLEMEHGSIDLEWLRDVPADKAKDFLLSIKGLGLKSVECVRLLTLHHLAFPVDTNVGRICVRLGWVPLQPLPESLQLHLLELYPMLETIQKYLWPRLCTLDQPTLYELHYQLITFGKVFCTKSRPNCNACPMRGECKHFASAFASARLALPGPEERRMTTSSLENHRAPMVNPYSLPQLECPEESSRRHCEPIIEEPDSPELESSQILDIEDGFDEDPDEIPVIRLNIEEFSQNIQDYMHQNSNDLQNVDLSKALVMISQQTASIPVPKLKNVSRLRTEHQVYELPDSHSLLEGLDQREAQDPCHYLLAIWSPGETAQSVEPPKSCGGTGELCDQKTCFSCNSVREAQNQIVRGTLLIPCRTAMRGSFPLNGTYFQVNEVFADHESSLVPINVPRSLIWNLPRRTVYFGTSIPTIFRGLAIQEIQNCFWRGFVCVRGFDRKTRGPRPLMARLHFPASKVTRNKRAAERNDE